MPTLSALEACDLIRFADTFAERLDAVSAELERKAGLEREKGWLQLAQQVLEGARGPTKGLIEDARGLPELAELRADFAGALQNAWVDVLEKLVAGITFHVSSRSPIMEALFPHQKFAPLRKSGRELLEKYQRDFEKRAKSGYVSRMLGSEDFAFAVPVLEQVNRAWADYQSCFSADGMSPEDAAPIRQRLVGAAEALDVAIRQARLLAEAALVPVPGAYDASLLAQKPKKRSGKVVAEVAAPAPAEAEETEGSAVEAAAPDVSSEETSSEAVSEPAAEASPGAEVTAEGEPSPASEASTTPAPEATAATAEAPTPEARPARKRKAPKAAAAVPPPSEG